MLVRYIGYLKGTGKKIQSKLDLKHLQTSLLLLGWVFWLGIFHKLVEKNKRILAMQTAVCVGIIKQAGSLMQA